VKVAKAARGSFKRRGSRRSTTTTPRAAAFASSLLTVALKTAIVGLLAPPVTRMLRAFPLRTGIFTRNLAAIEA
jgi:hypothetical protein